ncbi:unnamed protein product [Lupinus luteus]|uniref:Uncharacterized protein n=1 Tax=Lupinus luteus TaxID=3873 RepID=A0AAV1WFI7_LUPLU
MVPLGVSRDWPTRVDFRDISRRSACASPTHLPTRQDRLQYGYQTCHRLKDNPTQSTALAGRLTRKKQPPTILLERTLAPSMGYLHHGDYQKPSSIYQPSRPCTQYPSTTKTTTPSSQPKPSHNTRPTTNHPTPPLDFGTPGTAHPTTGQHNRGTSPA